MNDATLRSFRQIAAAMTGDTPTDWQWVGPHASQRMFGITQERAEAFAERHGGTARRMGRLCYSTAANRHYAERLRNPR